MSGHRCGRTTWRSLSEEGQSDANPVGVTLEPIGASLVSSGEEIGEDAADMIARSDGLHPDRRHALLL